MATSDQNCKYNIYAP